MVIIRSELVERLESRPGTRQLVVIGIKAGDWELAALPDVVDNVADKPRNGIPAAILDAQMAQNVQSIVLVGPQKHQRHLSGRQCRLAPISLCRFIAISISISIAVAVAVALRNAAFRAAQTGRQGRVEDGHPGLGVVALFGWREFGWWQMVRMVFGE